MYIIHKRRTLKIKKSVITACGIKVPFELSAARWSKVTCEICRKKSHHQRRSVLNGV